MSGLTYRGVELRDHANGKWFHIVGGPHGGLKVKGEDPNIPGKRGRWAGNRLADARVVFLHGKVLGTTATNYRALRDALDVIFDPELDAGDLVVGSDYPGMSGTLTIAVRFVNYMTPKENVAHHLAELDVELVTTDDPDWLPGS